MAKKSAKRFLPWWIRRSLEQRACKAAVRQRDGDNCWRCHRPMRFGPPFNCGKGASVEHLEPLSQGGTWALGNLVLCHVGCNRHLGANTPEQKKRMRLKVARMARGD